MTDNSILASPQPFESIPHWLLLNTSVSSHALRLYLILKKYAGTVGTAYPSRKRVAEDLGISVNTVDKARQELLEVGAVCHASRVTEEGDFTSNIYHVHWERTIDCEYLSQILGRGTPNFGYTGSANFGYTRTPNFGKRIYTHIEDKPNRTNTHPDGFAEFWANYPKKTAKQDAEKAWKQAVKKTDPETILAGLKRYLLVWQNTEKQFIPHPATWLRSRRWDDELDLPEQKDLNPDLPDWMREKLKNEGVL